MNNIIWPVTFFGSIFAGMIQGVTGFGAGIILVLLLSAYLSIPISSSVNTAVSLGIAIYLAWNYRKSIRGDLIIMPLLFYLVMSVSIIEEIERIDLTVLSIFFGAFLVCLAAFFLVLQERVHLKRNKITGAVCGLISGSLSGLFGIGGPPIGLYLISLTDNSAEYFGTIQLFFSIAGTVNMITRISCGLFTQKEVPITIVGLAGIIIGAVIGTKIAAKIDITILRKIVYCFILLAGFYILTKYLFL